MAIYRAAWMLLMVLIVTPAFIMASGVEGLSFSEAAHFVDFTLWSMGVPALITGVLAYPITLVATLIPGTSSLAVMFGEFFLWKGLGVVLLLAFFIQLEPPFYRKESQVEQH
ncbi:hypothetical protein [Pseudomonas putida]|uniref:Uncharacterized protein n=1 Tax=Pseudomonas putida TaxID=303 RepID=A0A8I1ECY5_PSEPU|nr:hypothetical protein [Pseudomonas putida]MBI6882978.1 hypothetical protein [Pseudomonas putida]